MKATIRTFTIITCLGSLLAVNGCKKNNDPEPAQVYEQEDQMGRPAINTVFVTTGEKDMFNQTLPSAGVSSWGGKFKSRLLALNPGYTTNLLGLDGTTFSNILAADVLTAALTGPTTFYDGTNVLTGRKLDDDVINVELILIFGGPTASDNPGLTDDHVNSNDAAFQSTFPYLATPH